MLFVGCEVGRMNGCDETDSRCVNDTETWEVVQRSMLASRKRYAEKFCNRLPSLEKDRGCSVPVHSAVGYQLSQKAQEDLLD